MKIGVVSDSHIPARAQALPRTVLKAFEDADHIVHAGDITAGYVIETLERLAPVTAVAGNLDPLALSERLGEKKTVRLGGFLFGVCHGHGKKGRTAERALACFSDVPVDCVIFGHSHIPCCRVHGGILLFNPGSPTDRRKNAYFSFGVIETGAALSPRLIFFDNRGAVIARDGCPDVPEH